MPALEVSVDQVVELIRQLPASEKLDAVMALARDATTSRSERMKFAESQLRRISNDRGVDWDEMSEDEREELIDALVHEDRSCS